MGSVCWLMSGLRIQYRALVVLDPSVIRIIPSVIFGIFFSVISEPSPLTRLAATTAGSAAATNTGSVSSSGRVEGHTIVVAAQ